jgi:hypothetical protein
MTTKNLFQAIPADAEITGFIFTDLDSYLGEYDHRHALFGTEEYDLQMIDGDQIDQELFVSLKINQATLTEWFNEIQILTFAEKIGLWFLVGCCGYQLAAALDSIQDGLTIFHGTKKELVGLSRRRHPPSTFNVEHLFQEFHFAGETWVGSQLIY